MQASVQSRAGIQVAAARRSRRRGSAAADIAAVGQTDAAGASAGLERALGLHVVHNASAEEVLPDCTSQGSKAPEMQSAVDGAQPAEAAGEYADAHARVDAARVAGERDRVSGCDHVSREALSGAHVGTVSADRARG